MAFRAFMILNGNRYEFATISFPEGLATLPSLVTNSLEASGVDGSLVINNRYAFRPFPIGGLVSYATLAEAQNAAATINSYSGRFGTFYSDSMGIAYQFDDIHFQTISARAIRDLGGGPFAVSGQTAIVQVQAMFRATSAPS